MEITFEWVGLRPHAYFEERQAALIEAIAEERAPATVLLGETEPVITLGRGHGPEEVRDAGGLEVRKARRGGGATYHGPGQLVVYATLPVGGDWEPLWPYTSRIEQVGVEAVAAFGLDGTRDARIRGVDVGGKKVASVTYIARKKVVGVGLALNVSPDLAPFAGLLTCGLEGLVMTSMAEALAPAPAPDVREVARVAEEAFRKVFDAAYAMPPEPVAG